MHSRRMLGRAATGSLLAVAVATTIASAAPRPEFDASSGLRPGASTHALALRARSSQSLLELATPASFDERYDVPTFLWATRGTGGPSANRARSTVRPSAELAARQHLGQVSGFYRLQASDVAEAPLHYVHD